VLPGLGRHAGHDRASSAASAKYQCVGVRNSRGLPGVVGVERARQPRRPPSDSHRS
jgi:hypothetical protein